MAHFFGFTSNKTVTERFPLFDSGFNPEWTPPVMTGGSNFIYCTPVRAAQTQYFIKKFGITKKYALSKVVNIYIPYNANPTLRFQSGLDR